MLIKLRKSQSTAEYAILFGLIIAAALAMQTYIKRSLNAKMKDAGDALTSVSGDITGDGIKLGTTKQYEPYYSNTYSKVTTSIDSLEKKVEQGEAITTKEREYEAESTDITDYDIGYIDGEEELTP